MGWIHYLAAKNLRNGKYTSFVSSDPVKRAGDWRGIQGNFGPPGEKIDVSPLTSYANFNDLLNNPEIDLIDLCTPTPHHPEQAIAALLAGKHVLVEKPIALSLEDADRMIAAANKANRMLMVAHVLPFIPEFQYVLQVVQQNNYGKLQGGQFKRIISQPDWSAAISDHAKTGGPAIDLHIHDTHFIQLLLGKPIQVTSRGIIQNGSVEYLITQYEFKNSPEKFSPVVSSACGALAMNGRPFTHGFELYFEKATLTYESGVQPLTIIEKDNIVVPKIDATDPVGGFTQELQMAVDAVAQHKLPSYLQGQLARDALALCKMECQSVQENRSISW